jgi:tetratricopeptide repeat protein 21B
MSSLATHELQTVVNFYAREGLFRHVQAVCNDALKKRSDDPVLLFWKAFGLLFEGQITEAIRELSALQSKKDLKLAVDSALIAAHERCELVDREAVEELTRCLPGDEHASNERGLLLTATFHWHNKQLDKARELAQKAIDAQPNFIPAQALRGWLDLTSDREPLINKSLQYFENALKSGTKKDVDALLGKAKYLEIKKQYPSALEHINQVIVLYPWFSPALAEKARVLVHAGEWEQAMESAQRIISQDSYNIEALKILVLVHLAREGRQVIAANRMGDLLQAIDRMEPKNAALYYNTARPFSRLAGRNQS